MNWILLATAGQFINAIVAVLDKYIVSDEKALPRPFVYAFYSCLLTGFWAVIYFIGLIPFFAHLGVPTFKNVEFPTIQVVAMAFLTAYTFFMALVSMYDALKRSDAAIIMPVIGTVSALSTFGMSYIFLNAQFTNGHMIGIILMSLGTLFVAKSLPEWGVVLHVFHSGIFFALHYITMKGLFLETSFDDGFFWSRISFVVFALSLLMVPVYWEKIREQTKSTTRKAGAIVLVTKVLAGVAAFLLLKATDLGEVSVVQALDGVRFVFILFITVLLAHWLPPSATDRDTRPFAFFRKLIFTIIITAGYFMLFT
jgi:drug/metabolite transporter (DMT)-like permease